MTDYLVEGRGGKTILRVVTSGFGRGDHWDEMLGAFGAGWDFELGGLRHYLERHRGTPGEVAWARARYESSHDEAWRRLTSAGGWFGAVGLGAVSEGADYAVRTVAGDKLSGEVRLRRPPRQFVATVREWNDALLRRELHRAYGDGAINVWLSTYGVPAADVRALQDRWQRALDGVMQA